MHGGLSVIDYIIMGGYLVGTILMGYLIGKKQKDTEDFLLAGRKMVWWPVAISLYASLFSAISYISMPGEAFNHGMTMAFSSFMALAALPIVVFVFLKLFYRLKVWTAYEYLEYRFSFPVRILGSGMFLIMRGLYLGVVLYATALAFQPATGWSQMTTIVVIGLVATGYTMMGGMAAVIWTDVIQFVVLLGGIIAVLFVTASQVPDGFVGIWHHAKDLGHGFNVSKESGFWDFDFTRRITIWAWLIGLLPWVLSKSTDQVNLQRCMTCRSFKDVAGAMIGATVGSIPMCFLFYFTGLAIFVYFRVIHPDMLPPDVKGDSAFTYMITHVMPVGIRGLLLAAILAAVMSTVDSVVNSMAASSVKDIYQRVLRPGKKESHYLFVARVMTLVWGILSIGFGALIIWIYAHRDIPLLEVSNVTLGFAGGILLGLFVLGLMTYRSTSLGAFIGFFVGIIITGYITYYYYLARPPEERISFMWISLIAPGSVAVIGYLCSIPQRYKHSADKGHVIWDPMVLRRVANKKAKEI